MPNFDVKAFKKVQNKPHSAQAVWFMNGFWGEGVDVKVAEEIWDIAHKFYEIQMGRRKFYGAKSRNTADDESPEGKSLDQFQSHRLLEHFGETKTASALRKDLATIDVDKNNKMSITEYLMFKYSKGPEAVINAPQGDIEEIKAAQAAMDEARAECDALGEKLAAAQDASREAKSRAKASATAAAQATASFKAATKAAVDAGAKAAAARSALNSSNEAASQAAVALADQQTAAALLKRAQDAVQAALDELNREQKKYDTKLAKLTAQSTDQKLGGVRRNRAINELAQLKDQDPLPLSRAKITQAASLKKCAKQTKKANRATAKCEAKAATAKAAAEESAVAAQEAQEAHIASEHAAEDAQKAKLEADHAAEAAEAARVASEEAAAALEVAFTACEAKMQACTEQFAKLQENGSVGRGKIWWMQREMKEIRKYMPRRHHFGNN